MKAKKKKILILSIAIVAVIAVIAGSTYAYWQITRTQETPNDIVAACLDITMQNESGTFGLDKAWPISDEEGEALTGYTFEVKNNCDENVNYIVGLNSVEGSSDNYLDYSSLRLKLDDKESSLISEFGDIGYSDPENKETVRDSKLLSMESLEGGGTATHNVKVWIDEDAPVTEQSKTFSGQVFITGGQGVPIYDDCFAINTDGAIMGYDYSCGYNVEVPATIAGIEVKTINQASFAMSNVQRYSLYNETTEEEKYVYYYTDESTADEFIDFAKEEMCEDPTTCTLDDIEAMGLKIITTEEEYNSIDWEGYKTSGYTVEGPEVGYFNSETGEIGNATSQVKALDLSKAVYLETIGESAFEYSKSLEMVFFPSDGILTTIGVSAFAQTNLSEVIIPSSVVTIEAEAFKGYFDAAQRKLQKVIFEDSEENRSQLATIGEDAFRENNISGALILPNSLETIKAAAFYNNQIGMITFEDTKENPSQLTTIEQSAFSYNKLSEVIVGAKNIGAQAFNGNQLTNVMIKNTVQTIGDSAFSGNHVTSLDFEDTEDAPSQLTTVGKEIFSGSNIKNLILPSSLSDIAEYAFYNAGIEAITIPNTVVSIESYAFSKNKISDLTIPASVTTLGSYVFSDNSLSSLVFEDTAESPCQLTSIPQCAFKGSNDYTQLVIPGSITNISEEAFYGSANLTKVIIKNTEGNVSIGMFSFMPEFPEIIYDPDYTE